MRIFVWKSKKRIADNDYLVYKERKVCFKDGGNCTSYLKIQWYFEYRWYLYAREWPCFFSCVCSPFTEIGGEDGIVPAAFHDRVWSDYRPMSNLYRIKEAKSWYPFRTLPYDPYKSSIAMFLAEFLYRALREEAENGPLFAYLEHSIRWLDECDRSFSNFHLVFLMRFHVSSVCILIRRIIGKDAFWYAECLLRVCPAITWRFFETGGGFTYQPLMRMNYETMHLFTMSRLERNRCLVIMNDYYRLHLPDFPVLKSLDVLKELFSWNPFYLDVFMFTPFLFIVSL